MHPYNTHQEFSELAWTSSTQLCNRHLLFLLHNQTVLFLRILGLESLPRKRPLQEVDEDIRDGLQVVSSTLLYS
jgi:hypothetical protein